MSSSEEVISEKFKIINHHDKYYEAHIFSGIEFEPKDLETFISEQKKLGANRLPIIVDCGEFAFTNVDLLKQMSKNKNSPYSKADAFIIKSPAQRILGNFYLNIIKPERPSRLFKDRESAYKWLEQHMS